MTSPISNPDEMAMGQPGRVQGHQAEATSTELQEERAECARCEDDGLAEVLLRHWSQLPVFFEDACQVGDGWGAILGHVLIFRFTIQHACTLKVFSSSSCVAIIRLMEKILHHLRCPKCIFYSSIKTFSGIVSGAGFFSINSSFRRLTCQLKCALKFEMPFCTNLSLCCIYLLRSF